MNTPHFVSTLGSTAASLAKGIGGTAADFAKGVGGTAAGLAGSAAGLAGSVGSGTAKLAKKVGPRRGLIGLAAIGALVGGGIVLARYLKRRRFEQESIDLSDAEVAKQNSKRRNRKAERAQEAITY